MAHPKNPFNPDQPEMPEEARRRDQPVPDAPATVPRPDEDVQSGAPRPPEDGGVDQHPSTTPMLRISGRKTTRR